MEKKLVNCPICGNKGLNYSELEFFNDGVLADWNCSNCKGYGSLDFKLSFAKFNNAFDEIGHELVLLDYDIEQGNELRCIIADNISWSKAADKLSKAQFKELEDKITQGVLEYINKNRR